MTLSKKATKYLRYLSKHVEYRSYIDLEKDYKNFNEQHFYAILDSGFLDIYPSCDFPLDPDEKRNYLILQAQFRINDRGFAYLDSITGKTWEEVRAWIAITLSLVAIVVSIISIFL